MLQVTSVSFTPEGSVSSACDLGINQVVAFIIPPLDVAISLYLRVSIDGVNFEILKGSDGNQVTIPNVDTGGYYLLPPEISYALPRFIQLELSDIETTPKTFQVLTREV
jgi:hypothetical protein